MKVISLILIGSIVLSCNNFILGQTSSRYEADLIIKKGNSADKKNVVVWIENGTFNVTGKKDKKISHSLNSTTIKTADYSFSEKPQIAEGIAVSLIFGWIAGLPFFFTSKKKHWLVLSTETEGFLFELNKDNYRQFIFDINNKGIKINDLGDRNFREPAKKEENKKQIDEIQKVKNN